MAGRRMTRDAFNTAVQNKMQRYHMSMDQAISDTLREVEGPFAPRRPVNDIDPYRDKQRFSVRDHPHGSVDRDRHIDLRKDNISNQPYLHELEREPYGGRRMNNFLDRLGSGDLVAKERFYREKLNAPDHRISTLAKIRPLHHEEFLSRDLNLAHRNWEVDRPLREQEGAVGRLDVFRDLRSQSEFGPMNDAYNSQRTMGQVPKRHTEKKSPIAQHIQSFGSRPDEPYPIQQDSENKPGGIDGTDSTVKTAWQIVKWAKFNSVDSEGLQLGALFKVDTETCKMAVECFEKPMTSHYREMCFASVRHAKLPFALRRRRMDTELLDLLVESNIVASKNDFFDAIKPFDMEMMMIQQRLVNCVLPLLYASNEFERAYSLLRDPEHLFSALEKTVLMCQRSLVMIGQTFALITSARRHNVLNVLGIAGSCLSPLQHPNLKNSFLFGSDFIWELKTFLKKKDNKITLKPKSRLTANTNVAKEEELKSKVESQERKAADPKVVATIDRLLENAKKGNQVAGQKSEFWFLFDEGSNEYKYYRQKFEEFQESKGQKRTKTRRCKRSPEELASESVRAMLYARKVQRIKRRLYRSSAFSRKRKQAKRKRCEKETSSVEGDKMIKEQELDSIPTEETATENSACEAVDKSVKTPEKVSVLESTDAEEHRPEKEPIAPPPDVDEKTVDTAIKLAQFVAQMGPEIEQFSMENSVNNPEFWFLCEKDSSAYKFYKTILEEFKEAEEEATTDDEDIGLEDCDLENIRTGDEPQNDSDGEMNAECEAAEAPSAATTVVAAFSEMPTPARPPIARKRVANLKVGMLPAKRMCLVEEPKIHDPVRIAYERPLGRGYNRRKKPVDLEFAYKKLTQQNVGFQILNKMGWKEGEGLGSDGSGIKNPINVGTVSGGEGLGAEEKKAGKSTNFDVFRQRMIEMYKQKITK
ncbi:SURP and G-patch domain-containing protein 2-like [Eleutherodactylus coqui]|uniref:SURP and G-patch domain-containing protein 2-like n=1 Tax=Eleutherodactylus coqui TaxID=57060 RepID=UPI0034628371